MSNKSRASKTFLQVGISLEIYRISYSEVFHKIGVRENFAKFTGKHLYQSFFSIKLQSRYSTDSLSFWSTKHCKCLGRPIMLG